MSTRLIHADSLDALPDIPDSSIDSIVTDPPYGLGFMGKRWDALPPGDEVARELLRVLKPGGHVVAFGGTRTYHRLACALEDAGFEIRDSLMWIYGSGFPKSLDVSKAIDKLDASHERRRRGLRFTAWMRGQGLTANDINKATETCMGSHYLTDKEQPAVPVRAHMEVLRPLIRSHEIPEWVEDLVDERTVESENFKAREVVGKKTKARTADSASALPTLGAKVEYKTFDVTNAHTPEATQWQGWGTALKPSHEPIVLARKPLDGTVAANVQQHGTGALNVDGCRVDIDPNEPNRIDTPSRGGSVKSIGGTSAYSGGDIGRGPTLQHPAGRWPPNVLLTHGACCGEECGPCCPVAEMDEQSGESVSVYSETSQPIKTSKGHKGGAFGAASARKPEGHEKSEAHIRGGFTDSGGASRFFPRFRYVAKASTSERNAGLEGMAISHPIGGADKWTETDRRKGEGITRKAAENIHPTVKPIELMRWLCKLVTPPKGTVLDPFMGSGTTGIAALRDGFSFIGIEREADYIELAERRINGDSPLFNSIGRSDTA